MGGWAREIQHDGVRCGAGWGRAAVWIGRGDILDAARTRRRDPQRSTRGNGQYAAAWLGVTDSDCLAASTQRCCRLLGLPGLSLSSVSMLNALSGRVPLPKHYSIRVYMRIYALYSPSRCHVHSIRNGETY